MAELPDMLIGTVALGWLITRIVQSLKLVGLKGSKPIIKKIIIRI